MRAYVKLPFFEVFEPLLPVGLYEQKCVVLSLMESDPKEREAHSDANYRLGQSDIDIYVAVMGFGYHSVPIFDLRQSILPKDHVIECVRDLGIRSMKVLAWEGLLRQS